MFEIPCRDFKAEKCWKDHVLILKETAGRHRPNRRVECLAPLRNSVRAAADSNRTSPEYKSEAIPLQKTYPMSALKHSCCLVCDWVFKGHPVYCYSKRNSRQLAGIYENQLSLWSSQEVPMLLSIMQHLTFADKLYQAVYLTFKNRASYV
jgi:hypothetical protein